MKKGENPIRCVESLRNPKEHLKPPPIRRSLLLKKHGRRKRTSGILPVIHSTRKFTREKGGKNRTAEFIT